LDTVILLRYGEIHLKGLNRPFFEGRLVDNIKATLSGIGPVTVIKGRGRFFVECPAEHAEEAMDRLSRVFGLISLSPSSVCERDMNAIEQMAVELTGKRLERTGAKTFRLSCRRADKQFSMDSMEMNRHLGGVILDAYPELNVNLDNADIDLHVEVRENVYLYTETIPGAGGMPVGSGGKAMLLLSGGIDSPVAGWMMAKRGLTIEGVHFHSFPYTSERAKEKVYELCRHLTPWCGTIRLHVAPFTEIQETIYQQCPHEELVLIMRRFMMRIAQRTAEASGAGALVTGESVGQVASQTLESITVTNDVARIPVFRPLIGLDKVEIMDMARRIDTYETSIQPYEDCCTIFTPKHPLTRPNLDRILRSEEKLDIAGLVDRAMEGIEVEEFSR
jgi:thiamine biosynthesis protein ThiI